jgi:hypothetical protein
MKTQHSLTTSGATLGMLFSALLLSLLISQPSYANSQTVPNTRIAPTSSANIPSLTATARADLAFDTQKTHEGIGTKVEEPFLLRPFKLTIVNKGNAASMPATIICKTFYPHTAGGLTEMRFDAIPLGIAPIAAGATFVVHPTSNTFSSRVTEFECTIDPTNAIADSDRSNNRFVWKQNTSLISRDLMPSVPPVKTVIGRPDIEFVASATTSGSITVRNIGTAATDATPVKVINSPPSSTLGTARCEGMTKTYISAGTLNNPYAGPAPFTLFLPVLAIGETKTIALNSTDYVNLKCSILGVQSEQNTANNNLDWRQTP